LNCFAGVLPWRLKSESAVSILCFTCLPMFFTDVQAKPEKLLGDWDVEYLQLQKQIQEGKGLAKSVGNTLDSKILDRHALIWSSDTSPVDVALRRTQALLGHVKTLKDAPDLSYLQKELDEISKKRIHSGLAKVSSDFTQNDTKDLYMALRKISRQVALNNPLLDFDDILFNAYARPGKIGTMHMCTQYLGWNARNGGGLYIAKNIKSGNPSLVNVLENSTVQNGRFQGQKLTDGAFLSPDLSFDGNTIVFAWTNEQDQCYHIFKVNADGTNLVQLTDGENNKDLMLYMDASQNDFDPCWLPDGRIAFISERRGGGLRCSGMFPGQNAFYHFPSSGLYSMKSDGSDLFPLSYHETNEWQPSVNNDGMIVYTRWDYLDRDDCIAHHIWTCFPDGRDPRAPHGNYPLPYSTVSQRGWDGRRDRPDGEWNIRAIPGSRKYVATAATHHHWNFGELVLIDTRIPDDGKMSQVTGITTDRQKWYDKIYGDFSGPYGTAWPLSEDYYLSNYNEDLILLDRFGNRDVIVRASDVPGQAWRLVDPIPFTERETPPMIPTATYQGERLQENSPNATIFISNVYVTDGPGKLPDGVTITHMRIVQVVPQLPVYMNIPRIGYASESLVRMPLGVVPVEEDGSVYCEAPVEKEIYFQMLNERGMAVQSMRSGTYVHPGEQMSCVGCHESKWETPPGSKSSLALQRPPSKLTPEVSEGAVPYNWHVLVKPVLEEKCAQCHREEGGPDMSYGSLKDYAYYLPVWWTVEWGDSEQYTDGDIIHSGSRSTPGRFGAMESRLYKEGYLDPSHYDVNLTEKEFHRITLWLDMNSNELGAYSKENEQRQGRIVWPEIVDPENPLGVERRTISQTSKVNKNEAFSSVLSQEDVMIDSLHVTRKED